MTNALTQRHRAQQLLIQRDTSVKVQRLWPGLDFARLDESYPALAVGMAAVVQANRQTSSGVAAQYVRAIRRAQGLRGDVKVILPRPLIVDQLSTSLRVTSVAAVKTATAEGAAPDVAMTNALTQTIGAMGRLVLNAGRETVRATSIADPSCEGWVRVGSGECDWCQQYLDGEVHAIEGYDFEAHDHCRCTAEPVYRA